MLSAITELRQLLTEFYFKLDKHVREENFRFFLFRVRILHANNLPNVTFLASTLLVMKIPGLASPAAQRTELNLK